MIDRRRFLLSSACVTAFAAPALAQQQDAPKRPPRWMMEDTIGNVITNSDFQGKFVLLFFGYTFCPDICPTTLSTIAETMDLLGDKAEEVQPLFVTVDPKRDTATVLREYTNYMHPAILGLRGPAAYTEHMAKAFKIKYVIHEPDAGDPENYAVDHSASAILVGPDGFPIKRYPHGISSQVMTEDLLAVMDQVTQ